MRLRHVYLALCVLGLILPYSQFIPWLLQNGLDLPLLFCRQLFANQISGFFGLDVIVATLALWVLVFTEGRHHGARYVWLPVIASLLVGVSLALPLYLYLRQLRIDATSA